MIIFKRCRDVSMDDIFNAFKMGFSDYIIKLEIPKEIFEKRFFGAEGNSLEYSFTAFDDKLPIGLILGGIKVYEGIKTLRCGTLCVHPEYRGKGISQKLYELHKQIALDNNCKQLFLEVIVGNDRAINFYKKLGYDKIYDLAYYSSENLSRISNNRIDSIEFKEIDFKTLKNVCYRTQGIHINWQNDFDYIEKMDNQIYYGAYQNTILIGGLSIGQSGKISFLWVKPELRLKGIAKNLIAYSIEEINPQKLSISFPNNASLEGFLKSLGFKKDSLAQYEMYITLKVEQNER
jgi:ribosomal protein S18 acetylase RimI-like enzyme